MVIIIGWKKSPYLYITISQVKLHIFCKDTSYPGTRDMDNHKRKTPILPFLANKIVYSPLGFLHHQMIYICIGIYIASRIMYNNIYKISINFHTRAMWHKLNILLRFYMTVNCHSFAFYCLTREMIVDDDVSVRGIF